MAFASRILHGRNEAGIWSGLTAGNCCGRWRPRLFGKNRCRELFLSESFATCRKRLIPIHRFTSRRTSRRRFLIHHPEDLGRRYVMVHACRVYRMLAYAAVAGNVTPSSRVQREEPDLVSHPLDVFAEVSLGPAQC